MSKPNVTFDQHMKNEISQGKNFFEALNSWSQTEAGQVWVQRTQTVLKNAQKTPAETLKEVADQIALKSRL